jgi:hypothetical protein
MLKAGARLGPYEMLSPGGEGMGEATAAYVIVRFGKTIGGSQGTSGSVYSKS